MTSARLLVIGALGALSIAGLGCGDDGESAEPTTTTAATTIVTTPTTETSTPGTEPTTATSSDVPDTMAPQEQGIAVSVYWTRPYGQARPIDIPAYRDPPGGPYPYVLYGSVTNNGAPIDGDIAVAWTVDGSVVHTTTVRALDPQGAPVTNLPTGAIADLLVVVDDQAIGERLVDAVATFEVAP